LSEKARIISFLNRRCSAVGAVTMSAGTPEKNSSPFAHSSAPAYL
jgi:hypothetical protein